MATVQSENRVSDLMAASQMTRAEVAEAVGVDAETVAAWGAGWRDIPADQRRALAGLFRVSEDFLLGETSRNTGQRLTALDCLTLDGRRALERLAFMVAVYGTMERYAEGEGIPAGFTEDLENHVRDRLLDHLANFELPGKGVA